MRRRRLAALALGAAATMGVVSLYQLGLIRRLPEPRWPYLDSAKVNGSAQAYSYLDTPDAVLGLGSYAATLALCAMGDEDRARRRPLLPVLGFAKVAWDVAIAAKLTVDQWTRHRAFCLYCLASAALTFAMAPLAFPEARVAWLRLRGK